MRPVMTHRRLNRAALLRSTALQAVIGLALAAPAMAQPAPNARPTGGQVVAGSASIGRTATATTITQSTNRAAIDWRGFDVGSNQSVTFQQPGSTSVTLNRVTGGDPSAIAGRITANGQIVLTNPSGVTFYQGAQVNAQSVIVSAADISNQNFMAGKMLFDRAAKPNARVDNRGAITVAQTGLAALVAPSVANSGVITARLGQVILAGAAAHTLDMYGDGLISIDVTKQVVQVPLGADGKAVSALVTNTGIIAADGGLVQLTASAVDGVVQTLVRAGGHIHADTVGGRTGRIEVAGTGGSVIVEGRLSADGHLGGEIAVAGSDTTLIAPTGHITANGRAGGGTIAIGTTLARARGTGAAPAGTSARTLVASGARISADATETGNGGRVTVLSTRHTSMDGALSARGGNTGGDGGVIEMSGELGFSLTGTADTSALRGASGTIVLDPRDLTISTTGVNNIAPGATNPNIASGDGGTSTDAYVTPAQIRALTGTIDLQATRNLTVASSLNYNGTLRLDAGNDLTVNAGVTVSVTTGHTLSMFAASASVPGATSSGTLAILGTVTAGNIEVGGDIIMGAGTGGITVRGVVTTVGSLGISTSGALTETVSGQIVAHEMHGEAASVVLTTGTNSIHRIGSIAPFNVTGGGFSLVDNVPLTIGSTTSGGAGLSVPTGQTVSLAMDSLTIISTTGVLALTAPSGTIALTPFTSGRGIVLTSSFVPTGVLAVSAAELDLVSAGVLRLGGPDFSGAIVLGQLSEGPVAGIDLRAHGGFSALTLDTAGTVSQNGPLTVNGLGGRANSLTLNDAGNLVANITGLTVASGAFATSGDLTILGAVTSSGALTLGAGTTLSTAGTVTAAQRLSLTAGTGGVALGADVSAPVLTINSAGPLTQTAGTVTTGQLEGNATSVSLTSRTNAVAAVANGFTAFAVTGDTGDFTLVNSVPLTIGSQSSPGGVSVKTGRTITLQTDLLTLPGLIYTGASKTLSAPGGTIVLTPFTTGTDVVLTAQELAQTSAATLRIGTLDATNAPAARNIVLGQAGETIDLFGNGYTALTLLASGAVTQGGPLAVATLSGQAGSLGLSNTGNSIQNLAGFATTTGNLALSTSSGLTVSGTVIANGGTGDVALAATGIVGESGTGMQILADISGATVSLDSTTFGSLTANGGIEQLGGVITATTLTGSGYYALLGRNNLIQRLGAFQTSGNLAVTTTLPLSVTGAVVSASGTLTLNANGLTQTAGSSISAFELDGTSTAATVLNNASNTLQSIGTFTQTNGDLSITSNVASLGFGANGSVISGTGSLSFTTDAVTLYSLQGIVAPGTVSFSPLTAGRRIELIGGSDADPASLSLNQAFVNSISAGTLQLGAPGASSPINIANEGETVMLTGSVGTLKLLTSGGVTEGRNGVGALVVGTLTGSTGGINLSGGNQIATLGSFTAVGDLKLTNTVPLVVAGPVLGTVSVQLANSSPTTLAGDVTGPYVKISADSGVVQAAGTISASGTLEFDTFNAITQSGGAIAAGTLTGSAGSVALGGASNSIATLSGFVSGAFTLADTRDLTTAAFEQWGDTSLNVKGSLTNTGTLLTSALNLNVSGAVTEAPGASESGGTLSGVVGLLGFSKANFATLGALTSGAGVTLGNTGPLTIGGPVVDGSFVTVSAVGGLTIAGSISAPTIRLSTSNAPGGYGDGYYAPTPGAILQTSGTISGGSIGIAASDALTLSGGLIDAGSGPVTLSSNAAMTLGNPIRGGAVSLTATSGTIAQPVGGSIAAASLTGAAGGTVSLLAGGNAIASLGGFTSAGGFALSDGQSFSVNGAVSDPNSVSLSTTGALSLAGNIQTGALSLVASGISQQSGSLVADSLTGSAGAGGAALTQTGNRIGTLLAFTSGGDLAVTDGAPVIIAGPVSAGAAYMLTLAADAPTFSGGSLTAPGGTVALVEYTAGRGVTLGGSLAGTPPVSAATLVIRSAGGPIGITAPLDLSGVSVLDLEGGAISETGAGTLHVANLTGHGATAALGGANQIGTLALFTTTGGFALTNAAGLSVSGPLAASTVGLNVTGDLSLTGVVSAPGGVSLVASGAISQPAGSIVAGTLSGQARSASLNASGNRIATLSGFVTIGDFSLVDGQGLTVTGVVDPNTVSLAVGGDLKLNSLVTGGTVVLNATGAVMEGAGGKIVAGTLTGAATSAALTAANEVTTLGGFTTKSGFALTNAQALSVTGPVVDGQSISLNIAGALSVAGTIQAPLVNLNAASLAQTGGTLTANTLSVATPGDFTQSGGSLAVTTIGGNVGGRLDLGNAGGAAIANAVDLSAGTGMTLADSGTLRLAGVLSARDVAVTATGALTLDGGKIVADSLTLIAQSDTNGAAVLRQTGRIVIQPMTGATSAVLLGLQAPRGTMTLNGLYAPTGDVVLALGAGGVSGNLTVGQLLVIGTGGFANLTGRVASRTGMAAAQVSHILPRVAPIYELNGCAIGAASCGDNPTSILTNFQITSVLRPDILTLAILDLSVTRDRDDPTLTLPNISDRDY